METIYLFSMEQITALQLFEQGLSKSQIKTMAQQAIESVQERGNVLQVAEALSAMELFIKEVKASQSFKDYAREEILKHKVFTSSSGAKITAIEAGTIYNYSKCGDVELDMLESALSGAESSLKARKEFLKNVPEKGLEVLVPYSGELITIYPPTKSSVSTYKITLAS